MGVLTQAGLQTIGDHKYQSGGYTPLDLLMYKVWWDHAIHLIPMWMAPNLVTLSGTFFLLLSFLVTFVYCPDLLSEAPGWVYLLSAVCQFLYQTLDAVDGKQARRTNSSSPLGQLFDHGCDSVGTLLIMLPVTAAIRMGVTVWTFLALIAVQGPFFLTQWEERHTHTCRTNTGGVGVTEGQWVSIIVLLITGLWGGDFWQYPLRVWAPAPILLTMESVFGPGVGDLMANQCLAILLVISNTLMMLYNLFIVSTTVRGAQKLKAFSEVLPMLLLVSSGFMWIHTPSFQRLPWITFSILGALFSHLTSQIILYSMAKMPFPHLFRQFALLPLPFVVYNANTGLLDGFISAELLTIVYFFIVLAAVFRFLFAVIQELTDYLNIYCLSLRKRPSRPKQL